MNGKYILQFLTELKDNNNREWFAENKDKYQRALTEFEHIVSALIIQISAFDQSIKGMQAKDCIYRIYRDVRFSHDKSPYKNHLGAYISAKGGRKSERAGYYIHFEVGGSMLGGGLYCPPPPILKAVRQSIYDNIEEYKSIVTNPAFKKLEAIGEKLKTMPQGYPKDFPDGEYLKSKDYTYIYKMNEAFCASDDLVEKSIVIFKEMHALNIFLNYTVDEVLEN